MITLKCNWCEKEFERKLCEHKRNLKIGIKNVFCCGGCSTLYWNSKRSKEFWKKQYENQKKTFDIKNVCGNRKDEYSPFRFFLNKGHASMIKHKDEIDIDEKYLKELWEKQNGVCPYTGIKMILPKTTHKSNQIKSLKRASLDRIDPSKGYLKNNVEFICYAINNAKNNFSKEEMKNFISEIKSTNL